MSNIPDSKDGQRLRFIQRNLVSLQWTFSGWIVRHRGTEFVNKSLRRAVDKAMRQGPRRTK